MNKLDSHFISTGEPVIMRATRVGTFEVRVTTHVTLRVFIMQILVSQLPFLANRNTELAVPLLFWPVNRMKIGGRVELLRGPTVYLLECALSSMTIYLYNYSCRIIILLHCIYPKLP